MYILNMDNIYLMIKNFKYDLLRLIEPYKHTSISTIDADIENQIEKVSKKTVVATGNVFINTLIYLIDSAKYLHFLLLSEFQQYMNIQNTDELQYVHIKEDIHSENNDISNEEEEEKEDDEQLYKAHDEALDEIINNEEENNIEIIDKKQLYNTSWFGFCYNDKVKNE